MDFAAENAENYEPPTRGFDSDLNSDNNPNPNFLDAISRDPIASLRSAIRNVCLVIIILDSHLT